MRTSRGAKRSPVGEDGHNATQVENLSPRLCVPRAETAISAHGWGAV